MNRNIVIKIVNRGLTNIKLMTAKLTETENIEILSKPEIYVGNIDSDDYETVEFNINVKSYEKTVELPVELKYMDSTNKEHQQKKSLDLKTFSKGKAATIVSKIIGIIINLAILVGIVLGIRWFYKRRKRNKKRQG